MAATVRISTVFLFNKFISIISSLVLMRKFNGEKLLSLKEAEKILPKVSLILEDLQKLHEILILLESVEIEVDDPNRQQLRFITGFNKSLHKLSFDFYNLLEKLEKKGCILKDIDEGIVDIFSNLGERKVLLCWKKGEKEISHWHEVDEDFDSRKKILDLCVKSGSSKIF